MGHVPESAIVRPAKDLLNRATGGTTRRDFAAHSDKLSRAKAGAGLCALGLADDLLGNEAEALPKSADPTLTGF
jgi:hypothetical protein